MSKSTLQTVPPVASSDIEEAIHDATLLAMQKLDAIAWLLQSVKKEISVEDDFFCGLGSILQDIHDEIDAAGGGEVRNERHG
jgi:hypothetical protein